MFRGWMRHKHYQMNNGNPAFQPANPWIRAVCAGVNCHTDAPKSGLARLPCPDTTKEIRHGSDWPKRQLAKLNS
jgi:hypothetical protein